MRFLFGYRSGVAGQLLKQERKGLLVTLCTYAIFWMAGCGSPCNNPYPDGKFHLKMDSFRLRQTGVGVSTPRFVTNLDTTKYTIDTSLIQFSYQTPALNGIMNNHLGQIWVYQDTVATLPLKYFEWFRVNLSVDSGEIDSMNKSVGTVVLYSPAPRGTITSTVPLDQATDRGISFQYTVEVSDTTFGYLKYTVSEDIVIKRDGCAEALSP